MIGPVTLTAEEFKSIHNGVCELRYQIDHLSSFVNERLAESLAKGLKSIESGLASAYQQDETIYDRRSLHYTMIGSKNNFESIWSMDEVEDLNEKHPFTAAVYLTYKLYGNGNVNTVLVGGDTWIDLWRAADKIIKMSGDNHHIFIENFVQNKQLGDRIILVTGS